MAKYSTKPYIKELQQLIESRTGVPCEPWLLPQVRATASNMAVLDKVQDELLSSTSLVKLTQGSTGQQKNEVSPLIALYDKLQRTLILQFEAIGLNFNTTPSKVKEEARIGASEDDPLMNFIKTMQICRD